MWGKIVVVVIAVLLCFATELFFPVGEANPGAAKQKHFWAIMLLIFSLVLGLPIEGSFATQAKLDELKQRIENHEANSAKLEQFHALSDLYDTNFAHAEPALRTWADESLAYIRESWAQGWMPLARERASTKIVDIYGIAQKSIIATNVGSTNFYFGDANYAAANANARFRHIPIVRFYIYGDKHKGEIEMHDGKHPENIQAFYKEVKYLHNYLGSLYSAVIDVDKLRGEQPRDLLIVDDKFVAETLQSKDWEVMRAQATEKPDRIREAREHFRKIMGALDWNYVEPMKSDDVKTFFKSVDTPFGDSKDPAKALFQHLMEEVMSGPPPKSPTGQ